MQIAAISELVLEAHQQGAAQQEARMCKYVKESAPDHVHDLVEFNMETLPSGEKNK